MRCAFCKSWRNVGNGECRAKLPEAVLTPASSSPVLHGARVAQGVTVNSISFFPPMRAESPGCAHFHLAWFRVLRALLTPAPKEEPPAPPTPPRRVA